VGPAQGPPVVLDGATIEDLPFRAMPALGRGVSHKVLWHAGESSAGVMRLDEGGHVDEHTHRRAHHHLWVLEGTVQVLGSSLGPGSYVHIPAGISHALVNGGDGPAVFHYLYLNPEPTPDLDAIVGH
jgi:quercetin dioxygenase-like cupin family protein